MPFSFAGSALGSLLGYNTAKSNLALSRENLEWQKQQWEETKQREDNAVQRRVSDLQAAGLSPVLAAGDAASTSSPIKTEAPQMSTSYTDKLADAFNVGGQVLNFMQGVNTLKQQEQTIAKTAAEREYIDLQNTRGQVGLESDKAELALYPIKQKILEVQHSNLDQRTKNERLRGLYMELQREVTQYNLDLSRTLGQRTNDPTNAVNIAAGVFRRFGSYLVDSLSGSSLSPDILDSLNFFDGSGSANVVKAVKSRLSR